MLQNRRPTCTFVPKNTEGEDEYLKGFGVNEIFGLNVTGIVTARDNLVVDINRDKLQKRMEKFINQNYSDDEIRKLFFPKKRNGKYKAGDTRGWKLSEARKKIAKNDHSKIIHKINYRPLIQDIFIIQRIWLTGIE